MTNDEDRRRVPGRCRYCEREIGGPGPLARHEDLCRTGNLATHRMHVVMTGSTHERITMLARRTGVPAWKLIGRAIGSMTIAEAEAFARKEKE